jgi:hypothetical protein
MPIQILQYWRRFINLKFNIGWKKNRKILPKTYTFVLGDKVWCWLKLRVLKKGLVLTAPNLEMAIVVGPALAQIVIE